MSEQQASPSPAANGSGAAPDALFDQPAMGVVDAAAFGAVQSAISASFAPGNVERFLKSLERAGLRIRSFEAVLAAGKLGADTAAQYARLPHGDQGQIREFYLAALEHVDLTLRDRFFKLYAYY
jgi:hypothetical protein